MSILIFVIIIVVLILSHEFGHFIVAKSFGIRVDEFGIGFPPRLFGWRPKRGTGETLYSINAIPFGGFVKIFGEDISETDAQGENSIDRERSFFWQPAYTKVAVIAAGVFFNFLLGWLIFASVFMVGTLVSVDQIAPNDHLRDAHVVVTSILQNSPAAHAQLQTGDTIKELNTKDCPLLNCVKLTNATPETVRGFIASHAGVPLQFLIVRNNQKFFLTVTPASDATLKRAVVGITMDQVGTLALDPLRALVRGFNQTISVALATVIGLFDLVRSVFVSGGSALNQVSGPVGIIGIVGEAAKFGLTSLLSLTALISINLAVLNLVPFPALDGGRLLFLLIEKLKGSPIKPTVVNTINMVGFYALILLMLVVTYHDVIKIVH